MNCKEQQRHWRLQRVQSYLFRLPISPYRAIVFGSVARGDFIRESDTDLLVVSDELPETVKARINLLFELRDQTPEIEPIGWLEREYQQRRAAGDPFIPILEKEGIFLPEGIDRKSAVQ